MKKTISVVLSVAMTLTLSMSSFAANAITTTTQKGTTPIVTSKPADSKISADIEAAKTAYKAEIQPLRKQLNDLKAQLVKAMKANDKSKTADLQAKIKALSDQIKAKTEAFQAKIKSIAGITAPAKNTTTAPAIKVDPKKAQIAKDAFKNEIQPLRTQLNQLEKQLAQAKAAKDSAKVTELKAKIKTLTEQLKANMATLRNSLSK